jgi:UDPglucose--hexose-1-phosphate uridylyltransferase
MSELRQDPIHRRWVIMAPERARRLDAVPAGAPPEAGRPPDAGPPLDARASCPFCPGHEPATPPEVLVLRPGPGGPLDWCVRVVPNRVPALRVEGDLTSSANGVYDRMTGIGAHEVVIESPDHAATLADMEYRQVERVVEAWQLRQRDLFNDHRLEHVLVFKNHGIQAGALVAHSHSQIIATPITPFRVASRIAHARAWYRDRRRCVFCDVLDQELAEGSRVVWADRHFAVLCPYASRYPFELLVLPRRHEPAFVQATPDEAAALARVLRDSIRRLCDGLGNPPYNLVLHTAPNPRALHAGVEPGPSLHDAWHWHLEILPRLAPVAGFEWGSGFFINPTPPEDAAAFLRGLSA